MLRPYPELHEVRDTINDRAGFPRPRPGNNEVWSVDGRRRLVLRGVELILVVDLKLLRMDDMQLARRFFEDVLFHLE